MPIARTCFTNYFRHHEKQESVLEGTHSDVLHAQRTYLALQPLRMEATQASEYQKQVQELRTEVEHHACCSIEKLTVLVLQVQGEIDLQIEKLEQKLAELHATDVKALDRAHKSLCQHIDALQLESTVNCLLRRSTHVLRAVWFTPGQP